MGTYPVTKTSPMRVGIIGYGLAGSTFHAPHVAAVDDLELAYVVTTNEQRAEQARAEHPGVQVVPDVAALLEHDDLDLVVVASPGEHHYEHAKAVIEAGVACLVDKPFVTDLADGHDLIALANDNRVPLTVFQSRRYDDDYLLVREVVRSGRLGQIYRFESRMERWQPVQAKAWKAEGTVEDGAGLLYDLGAHLLDQALQLFGEPEKVYAEIDNRSHVTRADDDTVVSLWHKGGVRSLMYMSTVVGIPGPRFTVIGEKGALVVPTTDRQEACLKAGARPGDEGYAERTGSDLPQLVVEGEEVECPPMRYAGLVDFYRDLAAYLRGAAQNPVDPASSLAVVGLIHRLHEEYPLR